MSTPPSFGEWALAFVTEVLAKANAVPDDELDDEFDEEPEESDEVRELRIEYGYQLLAEQAKVEELEAKLKAALIDLEAAYKSLRIVNYRLQKAFGAYELLQEALYGVVI